MVKHTRILKNTWAIFFSKFYFPSHFQWVDVSSFRLESLTPGKGRIVLDGETIGADSIQVRDCLTLFILHALSLSLSDLTVYFKSLIAGDGVQLPYGDHL